MIPTRRSALVTVAGALALAPTALRAQPAPVTLRVATVPTETVMPYVYAQRAGLFERAGIEIQYSQLGSGAAIAAAVAGGAVDIGNSSILGIVLGRGKGVPFTIVAPSGIWTARSEGGLVVAASSTLHAPKDFEGKTVQAAAVNDINTLSMQAWMDQAGADSKSVRFVELPQMAAIAALAQGRVDAITITDPAFVIATADGKAKLVANIFSSIAPRFLLVEWFSTTDWVEKNRAVAERFSRAIADAVTYTNAHPDEMVGDIVAFTGVTHDLAARMRHTVQTPTLNAADIQPVIDIAARYKLLDKSYPASELISDAAIAAVK